MTEKPILFSALMVWAILEGRKTMTRLVLKPQPPEGCAFVAMYGPGKTASFVADRREFTIPLEYQVGDILWVREAWRTEQTLDNIPPSGTFSVDNFQYEADSYARISEFRDANATFGRLRPGTFMPRWASRITLRVTSVKVERLQDISEEDVMAEGCFTPEAAYAQNGPRAGALNFRHLLTSINGLGSWDENPWVAAYTFEVVSVAGRGEQ